MSDKRQLRKYGNGKSFLVETGTFQTNLRDGIQEEPKFELDSLEIKVQSIIEKTPDVLFKIESTGRRPGDYGCKVRLHSQRDKTRKPIQNVKSERKLQETDRHFVREGIRKAERNTQMFTP